MKINENEKIWVQASSNSCIMFVVFLDLALSLYVCHVFTLELLT